MAAYEKKVREVLLDKILKIHIHNSRPAFIFQKYQNMKSESSRAD